MSIVCRKTVSKRYASWCSITPQSLVYFQNVFWFHDTGVLTSIYDHKKSTAFLAPSFTKLANDQQHYVQMYHSGHHPDWTINLEIVDKNSFTPLSRVWLSLWRFSRTRNFSKTLSGDFRLRNVGIMGRKAVSCKNMAEASVLFDSFNEGDHEWWIWHILWVTVKHLNGN
jgi:hypothetical protein